MSSKVLFLSHTRTLSFTHIYTLTDTHTHTYTRARARVCSHSTHTYTGQRAPEVQQSAVTDKETTQRQTDDAEVYSWVFVYECVHV